MNIPEQQITSELRELLDVSADVNISHHSYRSALESIIQFGLKSGGEALIAGPTLSEVSQIASHHADTVSLHLGASPFETDVSGLLDSINDQTRLIYLGSPGIPTGTIYSEKEIQRILERAPSAIAVIDESRSLSAVGSLAGSIERHSGLVVIRSLRNDSNAGESRRVVVMSNQAVTGLIHPSSEECLGDERSAGAHESIRNSENHKTRISIIEENKSLLAIRLRSLGLTVRSTNSDSVLVEVAEPLEVQLALQQNGVESRNCIGQPQLTNWLLITVVDDAMTRVAIETLESLDSRLYLMPESSKRENQEQELSTGYSSTLTIKRGPEQNVEPASRASSIVSYKTDKNISNTIPSARSQTLKEN